MILNNIIFSERNSFSALTFGKAATAMEREDHLPAIEERRAISAGDIRFSEPSTGRGRAFVEVIRIRRAPVARFKYATPLSKSRRSNANLPHSAIEEGERQSGASAEVFKFSASSARPCPEKILQRNAKNDLNVQSIGSLRLHAPPSSGSCARCKANARPPVLTPQRPTDGCGAGRPRDCMK